VPIGVWTIRFRIVSPAIVPGEKRCRYFRPRSLLLY